MNIENELEEYAEKVAPNPPKTRISFLFREKPLIKGMGEAEYSHLDIYLDGHIDAEDPVVEEEIAKAIREEVKFWDEEEEHFYNLAWVKEQYEYVGYCGASYTGDKGFLA